MNANRTLKSLVLTLLATSLLAGCQDTGPKNDKFFVSDETQSVTMTLERQAANGSRHDAMLRDQHFDGERLNALGRSKLDRMMASPGPVAVYLPGPVDQAMLNARRESILAYAKDRGRGDDEMTIAQGMNPGAVYPAAPGITRLGKTELGNLPQGAAASEPDTNSDLGVSGNNASGSPGSTARSGG